MRNLLLLLHIYNGNITTKRQTLSTLPQTEDKIMSYHLHSAATGDDESGGETLSRAKLHSNYHHQQSVLLFHRSNAILVARPTALKAGEIAVKISLQCSDTVGWVTGRASGL